MTVSFKFFFLLLFSVNTAREALTDMPPRSEEELDAVTLHNQALMNMETKPHEGCVGFPACFFVFILQVYNNLVAIYKLL